MHKEELKIAITEALQEISPKKEKATMTINEAALYAGMAHDKLRQEVHKQNTDLPFFYVGSRVAINKRQFDIWLDKISQEHRNL